MNKTQLDVIFWDINPTIFPTLESDTKFITTQEHPLVVTGVDDLEEVLYKT